MTTRTLLEKFITVQQTGDRKAYTVVIWRDETCKVGVAVFVSPHQAVCEGVAADIRAAVRNVVELVLELKQGTLF